VFDFESSGTDVHSKSFIPTILGVSFQVGSGWVIPLAHKDSVFKGKWKRILKKFAIEVIENPAIVKVAYNALFDGRILERFGYRVRGRYFDAMLMKYILNEERPNGLKDMVDMFLPDFSGYDLSNKPGKKARPEVIKAFWTNVDIEELSEYCAMDCDCTFRLFLHFEQKLWDNNLYYWIRNFYMPLVRIYTKTILNGILVDRPYLEKLMVDYQKELQEMEITLRSIPVIEEFQDILIEDRIEKYIEDIEDEIWHKDLSQRQIDAREEKISRIEAGEATTNKERKLLEPLNFASVPQMSQLLYLHEDGFEFPILEKSKTGNPSTSESTLLKLQAEDDSGFIETLLKLRGSQKLYSTYVKGIYENHLTPQDKIHPSYLLHATVTGRTSSRNPSFQVIPRTATAAPIKKMFTAPKDSYFTEHDGSQMELRVSAELSGDKEMLKVFKEGKNIHVATAAGMFDIDYELINSARKDEAHKQHLDMVKKHKSAKVLNFTIFYGAGPKKVAEFLTERTGDKHSITDAIYFIDKWFDAYPGAEKWIKKTHKLAIRDGFVTNLFGRKRRLPILLDQANKKYEPGAWNEALRQSLNFLAQSTASDITQWIAIQTYVSILRGELPGYLHLLTLIHDSTEYYIHKKDVILVTEKIQQIARDLPDLKKYLRGKLSRVDMKFSSEVGINWGAMQSYDPDKDYDEEYDKLKSEEK